MKERHYRGFWDNGHDQGEIEYYSRHRNNSKKNMEDMKRKYAHSYGNYRNITFEFGYLLEE